MTHSYFIFGLHVFSNLPILGPQQIPPASGVDVQVNLGAAPPGAERRDPTDQLLTYSSPYVTKSGEPTLRVWVRSNSPHFRLRYADGTEFFLDRGGKEVWATWPPEATLEDTATYLLGPILGLVLRLRGTVCLHASAVAIEGRAVALLGPAGAGKSTTAAAFAQLGFPIFSDDVVPLFERDDQLFVQPAYPHLRLWPDSVETLYGAHDALPLLTPNWDKRYLDLTENGGRFQHEPLPLGAVYVLDARGEEGGAPRAEALPGHAGLMALVANTYVNYLLDRKTRAQEFRLLSRLVERVPLRRVRPSADPARLDELCRLILEDFAAHSGTPRV